MAELIGWLPTIAAMFMGAMVSQDVEGHLLVGTILLGIAVVLIVMGFRYDTGERR